MKRGILSHSERVYLTLCLKLWKEKVTVRWGNLYDVGLGRGQIAHITQLFRKQGIIQKQSYDINEKNLNRIKELLQQNLDTDLSQHDAWRQILPLIIIFAVVGSLMILQPSKEETIMAYHRINSYDDYAEYCITINRTRFSNRTIPLSVRCEMPKSNRE